MAVPPRTHPFDAPQKPQTREPQTRELENSESGNRGGVKARRALWWLAGGALALAILTQHQDDPTWLNLFTSWRGVGNWLGLPGALTGGNLALVWGGAALAWPLLLAQWGLGAPAEGAQRPRLGVYLGLSVFWVSQLATLWALAQAALTGQAPGAGLGWSALEGGGVVGASVARGLGGWGLGGWGFGGGGGVDGEGTGRAVVLGLPALAVGLGLVVLTRRVFYAVPWQAGAVELARLAGLLVVALARGLWRGVAGLLAWGLGGAGRWLFRVFFPGVGRRFLPVVGRLLREGGGAFWGWLRVGGGALWWRLTRGRGSQYGGSQNRASRGPDPLERWMNRPESPPPTEGKTPSTAVPTAQAEAGSGAESDDPDADHLP